MGGLSGIDWASAKALADPEDFDGLKDLLLAIETGALKGAARKAEQDKPRDTE